MHNGPEMKDMTPPAVEGADLPKTEKVDGLLAKLKDKMAGKMNNKPE